VRPPSALVMIVGFPPSMAATAELVVPKSIPTTCSTNSRLLAFCDRTMRYNPGYHNLLASLTFSAFTTRPFLRFTDSLNCPGARKDAPFRPILRPLRLLVPEVKDELSRDCIFVFFLSIALFYSFKSSSQEMLQFLMYSSPQLGAFL
jgi:hypothetical protein